MRKILVFLFLFPLFLVAEKLEGIDLDKAISEKRASQQFVFKNLFVFKTLVDKDKALGNLLYEYTEEKLAELKRFKVYDESSFSSELMKIGFGHLDVTKRETVFRMSDTLKLNCYVQPVISRRKARIDVELRFLDKDGSLFVIEKIENFTYKNNYQLKNAFYDLLDRLIKKIPYSGLINDVENELYTLDVGTKDNFKQNDVLSVFEIKSVKRHPYLGFAVDFKKETIGRLILLEVGESKSIAKLRSIKPGKEFLINMKIGKRVVPKDPFLFPEPKKTYAPAEGTQRFKSSLGTVEIRGALAMFKHVFSSANTAYNKSISTLVYPEFQILGDLWLTSKWIVSGLVQAGVVPIKDKTLSPTSLNAMVNQFAIHGKYRIALGKSSSDPQFIPVFGLYRYSFIPDNTEPVQLTKKSYYGLSIGAQFLVPLNIKLTLFANALVKPFGFMSESPQKSGKETSNLAYNFDAGVAMKYNETVTFTYGGKVDYYGTSFSGTSERGTPNATSSITSMGVFAGVRLGF